MNTKNGYLVTQDHRTQSRIAKFLGGTWAELKTNNFPRADGQPCETIECTFEQYVDIRTLAKEERLSFNLYIVFKRDGPGFLNEFFRGGVCVSSAVMEALSSREGEENLRNLISELTRARVAALLAKEQKDKKRREQ